MAGLYTIPPDCDFLSWLARGLLAETGGDAETLAGYTVLLPTRRGIRSLRETFLRLSEGQPLLLPRMLALGDLDPDELTLAGAAGTAGAAEWLDQPPPIAPFARQGLLTRLIVAAEPDRPLDEAAGLAAELARLLDRVQTERLSFDRLGELVPERFAQHWQITLDFLKIVTRQWPAVLAEAGAADPAERRNALLAAQAEAWRSDPPAGPVVAAGSTGSIPAAADLLATLAELPQGRVVLPGLDRHLDADSWDALEESHPQFALQQLLARLNVARQSVADWPWLPAPSQRRPQRIALLAEALRPAATTEAWQAAPPLADSAIQGLQRVDAPDAAGEAGAIATLLRDSLSRPGETAALVTHDRDLARRVAAELARWHVAIDDSAGRPLALTPPGVFLRRIAELAAEPLAPVALLAVLKHPLAGCGLEPSTLRARTRRLERYVLRGLRPAPGIPGIRAALDAVGLDAARRGELAELLDRLEAALQPLIDALQAPGPLSAKLRAHLEAAEALAATAETRGDRRLWAEEAGEAAATFGAELLADADRFPELPGDAYPALIGRLLSGQVVRPGPGQHPRLAILGPMEARLQHYDRVILGGLNEGTWPPDPGVDPWLSRPMKRDFGLPAPEFALGQAAQDFAQLACAGDVWLTRAARQEGAPAVPARWLFRLAAVLDAVGLGAESIETSEPLAWHAGLDRPAAVAPRPAPAPTPPVEARPRGLPVTQVEAWMQDPYGIYARHVLGLQALDPLDQDPAAAERGTAIHEALASFIQERPGDAPLPADALERVLAHGRQAFGGLLDRPGLRAFWWPRFERIAAWFVATEAERRGRGIYPVATERKGELLRPGPAGAFSLRATADRIDRLADGRLAIVDYKTGQPPKAKDIQLGYAPQLSLEAAIAEAGGFPEVPAAPVADLAFWQLQGGAPAGKIHPVKGDAAQLRDRALAGLDRLIAAFDDPAQPYYAQPDPARAPRFSDYGHLARLAEWATAAGD